jgi:hypothetical protein
VKPHLLRLARVICLAGPLACAAAFTIFLGYTGIPALRHDWSSWIADGGFFSNAWSSISGWRTDGFGSPRPFPNDYLLVAANAVLHLFLGNYLGYLADVFAVGLIVAAGAARFVRYWSPSPATMVAASFFAVFNPWVYNEVAAGHIYMILAYGAVLLLLSEAVRERPSQFYLGAFVLMTMGQLQFFLPSFLGIALWTIAKRERPRALIVTFVASLPVWIGLAGESGYLQTIPYSLVWQNNQSVDPLAAMQLVGYFALYANALPWFAAAAMWAIVALAMAGAIGALVRSPRRAMWPVLGALVAWGLASGTKGVLGDAYTWLVAHVSATGLYRELYDAVAFLCVAYIAGCGAALQLLPALRWLWVVCAGLLLAAWAVVPPARYWVPAQLIPPLHVHAPANTRYALMPPLQPVRYLWGSGLDPDAVVLPHNVTPLNTQQFSYPESPALVQYALTGDERWLEALSVAEVIDRPQFQTDVQQLREQLALPPSQGAHRAPSVMLEAAPELLLTDVPGLSALPRPLWENAIFFGDASTANGPNAPPQWRAAPRVRVVVPASAGVSAADGWVDARSAFAALPTLAQGLGGVITTNSRVPLPIDPSAWTLVFTTGALVSADGATIAKATHGYRWLRGGVSSVRCRGLCVVVGQTVAPFETAAGAPAGCRRAIAFRLPLSWLAVSELPPSALCLLRYNVRFDPHWLALGAGTRLTHVAIDSTANGWIVPAHAAGEPLIVVEWVAGVQFVAEIVSITLLIVLVVLRVHTMLREGSTRGETA